MFETMSYYYRERDSSEGSIFHGLQFARATSKVMDGDVTEWIQNKKSLIYKLFED